MTTPEIIKTAQVEFDIHQLIADRWSPRGFDAEKHIGVDTAMSLFEAARWAPSSRNAQPWEYYFALKQDTGAFQLLHDCLLPGNQQWAEHASMLILSVSQTSLQHREGTNRHALYDTGAANYALSLEAMNQGLYVHQIGGFHVDRTRRLFNLPEDKDPVVFLAVGHLGKADILPEQLQERERQPRTRKSLNQFVNRVKFPSDN